MIPISHIKRYIFVIFRTEYITDEYYLQWKFPDLFYSLLCAACGSNSWFHV